MPEPHIDPNFEGLTFRNRNVRNPQRSEVTSLFWTGAAIFIGVALVYPFYSYFVQTTLLTSDIEAGIEQLDAELEAATDDARRQHAAVVAESEEAARARRLRSVSLAGSSVVRGQRLVIVDLGQASVAESRDTICRLAELRFGQSLQGERLRVQRHRGLRPAIEMGIWTCR